MASYVPGFDEERFATKVNRNFLCLICFNVLKDPVLCPRNQHCFCRGCITKHLENSRRCPTCADVLTVATFAEPNRMVKDYLNELKIHCVHKNRGCQDVVQLQHIEIHETTCGFTPAVCSNQGCGVSVNKRDLIHHESEVCEFRKLKCHSCGEMTKTLADMEKKIVNLERNMATKITMETKMANVERKMTTMETNMKRDTADIKTDMEGKLEAVNNEVKGLKTALIEGFDEMKDVLVKVEDKIEENPRKRRRTASGDKENIIVAGGDGVDSVEMFNWRQRTWSPLQYMPEERYGATAFVYNNHVTVVGGECSDSDYVHDMISMSIDPNPDVATYWSECPVRLPAKLTYHSSVLYNHQLIVTGGDNGDATSAYIDEIQLVLPYTVKGLSGMLEPRQDHSTEIFYDDLLIVGGSTTDRHQESLRSVELYDIKKNRCKQLPPLPYEVSQMATVRWGDNIVIIGGIGKDGNILNSVVMYNVNTGQNRMLPPMRYKRRGCTAVVIGNNIVVLGGRDEQERDLRSIEAFNFENYTWQGFPAMSEARSFHTAVVV